MELAASKRQASKIKNRGFAPWQFISQGAVPAAHLFYIQLALDTGCKWIQLRLKAESAGMDVHRIIKAGQAVSRLCAAYDALFILNDHIDLVGATHAHGIHLGLQDCDVGTARRLLGNDFIIGGTANTESEVLNRAGEGVDYIGLGPFRFTETKKNLSPVLGIDGYRRILGGKGSKRKMNCPVYAIGAIGTQDLSLLSEVNIDGVAVSGWLTAQVDLPDGTMDSDNYMDNYMDNYSSWKVANRRAFNAVLKKVQGFEALLQPISARYDRP